jgi:hypothetical protein
LEQGVIAVKMGASDHPGYPANAGREKNAGVSIVKASARYRGPDVLICPQLQNRALAVTKLKRVFGNLLHTFLRQLQIHEKSSRLDAGTLLMLHASCPTCTKPHVVRWLPNALLPIFPLYHLFD